MRASTLLVVFDSCAQNLVNSAFSSTRPPRNRVWGMGSALRRRSPEGLPHMVTDPCSYVGQGFSPADTEALKGCPTCYGSAFGRGGRASALLTRSPEGLPHMYESVFVRGAGLQPCDRGSPEGLPTC